MKTALGLEPHHVEEVLQTVEITSVAISSKIGNAIHVLFIFEPVSCQPIAYTKEEYRHLADLDLTHFSWVSDELQIDALIGSDHYWQLVTGIVIQVEGGPTAIHTYLGGVLSGPMSDATAQQTMLALSSYPKSHNAYQHNAIIQYTT